MRHRHFSYDHLATTSALLSTKLNAYDNRIFKSVDFDSVFEQDQQDIKDLCKDVYKQFKEAQADHAKGLISEAWYRDILTKMKDLLTCGNKITVPELQTQEIVVEITKYIA